MFSFVDLETLEIDFHLNADHYGNVDGGGFSLTKLSCLYALDLMPGLKVTIRYDRNKVGADGEMIRLFVTN
jgi:hypothetical protein